MLYLSNFTRPEGEILSFFRAHIPPLHCSQFEQGYDLIGKKGAYCGAEPSLAKVYEEDFAIVHYRIKIEARLLLPHYPGQGRIMGEPAELGGDIRRKVLQAGISSCTLQLFYEVQGLGGFCVVP